MNRRDTLIGLAALAAGAPAAVAMGAQFLRLKARGPAGFPVAFEFLH